ncbi:sporulation protein YqfC [Shouchella lonarensis]|uniref:Sporulation protein YqfC n=1 Tax=Shouchella lonarensis TaxID=1464122 RepID=A0A1G6KKQ0_9BACI|nr:sporulation protein YqfC [Shouchella lonarensis]SDC31115.1 sporulation protein YqfC [Shouchella lonarensis]
MKKMANNMKRWLGQRMQLPADVMMDLPRITMIGQLHIYIENHCGVQRFSREEICLFLKQGQLLIRGSGFILKTIMPEELLLEGRIEHVSFIQDETKKK